MKRFLPRGLVVALVASTWPLLSASLAGASMPTCIVSLSPTATDTLFTIGAGAQVKAVDQDSTVPLAAARLARKDKINALNPSAEAIAALCPSPPWRETPPSRQTCPSSRRRATCRPRKANGSTGTSGF